MRLVSGCFRRRGDGLGNGDRLVTDGGNPTSMQPDPTLPPPDGDPARLLALPGDVVSEYHRDTIAALLDDLVVDAIAAAPPRANTVSAAIPPGIEYPVLSPSRSHWPESVATDTGKVLIATIPDGADTLTASDIRGGQRRDGSSDTEGDEFESHRVCLTTRISLDVDPYERSTSFEGLDDYRAQLPDEWLSGASTHCSTALRAGYRTTATVDGKSCSLVGIGHSKAPLGIGAGDNERMATLVEVYRNGAVGVEIIDPESFGLRGIDSVGEKRAETLRQAGYETPIDVADTPLHELTDLSGLGRSTSRTIQAAAEAKAHNTVVATGDDSLPYGEPVFIDIETDGLEPSCVWLIGVLDGDAEEGHYMAFDESKPGDTGHLEAFLNWMRANASGRPLVAWNGYKFDFPVLKDKIRHHCPEYLDDWEDAYQFDLLWWARDKNGGNVALPGRDNKLKPVAEALGWQPKTTGIDGGVVARVYSAYRRRFLAAEDQRGVEEPDWERLKQYCEDDVRALATVYHALADAARREPGVTSEKKDKGTQGALSDFT